MENFKKFIESDANKEPKIELLSAEAAKAADTTHSGPIRSCMSNELLCYSSAGLYATGNKEVILPQKSGASAAYLDSSKTFTVCYSDGTGTVTDPNWRDSYIRVSLSKVASITLFYFVYFIFPLQGGLHYIILFCLFYFPSPRWPPSPPPA